MSGSITAHSGLFWDATTGSTVGSDLQTAITNAQAQAALATTAATSATASANSALAASAAATAAVSGAVTSVNNAATTAQNNLNTSVTNATTTITNTVNPAVSSASASQTAAAASATAAASSQTAAASSASAASSSASAASTSASGASTSATSAASSATAAASSASTASSSATTASSSATTAGNSATAASSSATAAAASATLAANPPSVTTAGNIQGTSFNSGPQAGFRNAIINGHMDIWQRGTSITAASGAYLADRWKTSFDGSGSTTTVSQAAVTAQAILDTGPTYCMAYTVSSGGTGGAFRHLMQPIENVRTFSGQTVTVSFWAWLASGTGTVGVQTSQVFGTGGSPSATVTQSLQNVSLTTTPTNFKLTFTLPSIVGKTVGTNGDSYLGVYFNLPLNSAYTFNITGVQVEQGPVATPMELRPPQVSLALCQRYYQIGNFDTLGYQGAGATFGAGFALPVTMRAIPTATVAYTNSTNATSPSISVQSASCVVPYANATSTGTINLTGSYTLSAEL